MFDWYNNQELAVLQMLIGVICVVCRALALRCARIPREVPRHPMSIKQCPAVNKLAYKAQRQVDVWLDIDYYEQEKERPGCLAASSFPTSHCLVQGSGSYSISKGREN